MDRINHKKDKRRRGQVAGSQHSVLDRSTKEDEVETGSENCFAP